MSIVVTVRFPESHIDRFREVSSETDALKKQLGNISAKYGMISHRRVVSANGEVMDIDEWETEEGLRGFQAEAEPVLRAMSELRGNPMPVDVVWYAQS